MEQTDRIILALNTDLKRSEYFIDYFNNYITCFKIGLPLYFEVGNDIIDFLHAKNKRIILDLNLCSQPSIAAKTIEQLINYGVDSVTVNLFGGLEMLKAIHSAANGRIEIIGTVMSPTLNTTQVRLAVNNRGTILNVVDRLTKIAVSANIGRILCSPYDNKKIKHYNRILYNNGIRFKKKNIEHRRWMSPKDSIDSGASYLIIGREITDSLEPFLVYHNILGSLS